MGDTNHSSIRAILDGGVFRMNCPCNEAEVTIRPVIPEGGVDWEGLEEITYPLAGYNERGMCKACADQSHREEVGENQILEVNAATDY